VATVNRNIAHWRQGRVQDKMRAMTETPPGAPEFPPADPDLSVRHRVIARLRNYLIAGVLVTAPIGLTVYLAWSFIHWMDEKVMVLIPDFYHPETYLPFSIPGLGLFVVVAGLILIGGVSAGDPLAPFFAAAVRRYLCV